MTKLGFMDWLEGFFKNKEQFTVVRQDFGPDVPSNCVHVNSVYRYNGQGKYLSVWMCEGYQHPQVHGEFSINNILLLEAVADMWKKVRE